MKRTLRVCLWAFAYWFCGVWWLARYLDVDSLRFIAGDAVLWAFICLAIESMRLEVVE